MLAQPWASFIYWDQLHLALWLKLDYNTYLHLSLAPAYSILETLRAEESLAGAEIWTHDLLTQTG